MAASSPSYLLLHRIVRPPPPPPAFTSPSNSLHLLPKSHFFSASSFSIHCHGQNLHLSASTHHRPVFLPSRELFSSLSPSSSLSSLRDAASPPKSLADALCVKELNIIHKEDADDEDNGGGDGEEIVEEDCREERVEVAVPIPIPARSVPTLSVKEKKDLASYAHSLGDKLKSQQVGKSGVTANVVMALCETLEANELLKLKVHRTCPGELDDVVSQLEQATGSVAVGQIGRTVIFYRPSIAKLEEDEKKKKKKPTRRAFERKPQTSKPSSMAREKNFRNSGRGRHGSSGFR
ncbi:hypothetical protein Dimus_026020 [Dionaea muscipula]